MTINRELQSVTIRPFAHETEHARDLATSGHGFLIYDEEEGWGNLTYPRADYDYVVDSYGQLVPSSSTRTAEMALKVYSQQNVQDPRYVDVEMVGLTKDTSIVPGEVVSLAQGDYRVKYVIPTGRWQEILLAKL